MPPNEPVNPKKKRLRDLTRALKRPGNLPANVRADHERELSTLQHDLEQTSTRAKNLKIARRYKMVRLFERRKALRSLEKAQKQSKQAESDEDCEYWKEALHKCRIDLNYTIYHPIYVPYSSLYRSTGQKGRGVEEAADRSNAMWGVVEEHTAAGTLESLKLKTMEDMNPSMGSDRGSGGEAEGAQQQSQSGSYAGRKGRPVAGGRTGRKKKAKRSEGEDEGGRGLDFFEAPLMLDG